MHNKKAEKWRMPLSIFFSPSPDPSYLSYQKKKRKNQAECSSKLSGQLGSQSAPCILAVSSGSDIEEGSTALLLPFLLCMYMRVCVYVRVCVCVCV